MSTRPDTLDRENLGREALASGHREAAQWSGPTPTAERLVARVPRRSRSRRAAADLGHRLLPFLELQIAMALGALVCLLFGRAVRALSTSGTDYHPGTVLFFFGDVFFLTLPVVAWMLFRNRGWRHSLELGLAMLAPVVAIVVLGELTGFAYLLWLVTAMYPAMSVGMLVYILHRRDVL